MDTLQELSDCLALQNEIDAKTLELRKRYKAVIEAERAAGNNATICVEIAGEMYGLQREDSQNRDYREAMKTARELGGFWVYRLFKIGKTVRK